jgi:hypothetical protein
MKGLQLAQDLEEDLQVHQQAVMEWNQQMQLVLNQQGVTGLLEVERRQVQLLKYQ